MVFSLVQADKDLFAIYQTMYSKADIEMWYDWNRQLDDTKWTDQCFFVMLDGKKVGGVIITDHAISYPFLISPFCERVKFWSFILNHYQRDNIKGVLAEDVRTLLMFDYKIETVNQVMCRPTDVLKFDLPDNFICRSFDMNIESDEIGNVIINGYKGSICDEINGAATLKSAIDDVKNVLSIYSHKNFSQIIAEKATNKIVAVCLAGIGENYTHNYVEIADICVLPEFRGIGLARYLIGRVITDSYGISPFVKLFLYVGNNAEYLYHKMGFISGPQFTNMTKRRKCI
ncbi:MAG: GNAT family N-acetyltransferase [Lachnospiraceae bacterium]|nr:GNAT family N-acetyltransferase [Lachnospiraceae bacterium]